jgi:hypothetical protein
VAAFGEVDDRALACQGRQGVKPEGAEPPPNGPPRGVRNVSEVRLQKTMKPVKLAKCGEIEKVYGEGLILPSQAFLHSGRGAVWLARLNGVQEVAGSNPVAPTQAARGVATTSCDKPCGFFFRRTLPGVGQ